MLKKVLLLLTLVFAMFSCEVTSEGAMSVKGNNEQAEASIKANVLPSGGEYVKVLKTFSLTGPAAYGRRGTTRTYTILVKNVAYDKQVFIHQERLAGQPWQDLTADYVGPADTAGTYEIWEVEVSSYYYSGDYPYGDEFVAKYIVSGSTYWDNNNGNNYTIGTNDGIVLYNNLNVDLEKASFSAAGTFSGSVVVKNIAYAKDVEVVYTTDNWGTQHVIDASYAGDPIYYGGWYGGVSVAVQNPNSYGFEVWNFTDDIGNPSSIKFYVRYTVNGVTYYDNNYSKNYFIDNVVTWVGDVSSTVSNYGGSNYYPYASFETYPKGAADSAKVWYTTDDVNWYELSAYNTGSSSDPDKDKFSASFPTMTYGTTIKFYIQVTDKTLTVHTIDNGGSYYSIVVN